MTRYRLRIYEIEHQGDESHALEALHQAGATNITVESRDEWEESMVVGFHLGQYTDKQAFRAQLEERGVCL